jgi:hypothetical protein
VLIIALAGSGGSTSISLLYDSNDKRHSDLTSVVCGLPSESHLKVKHFVGQVFGATLKMVTVPALGHGQ